MKFKPLTLDDKDIISPYLCNSRLIDMGFSSLFSISEEYCVEYAVFRETLLLKMNYSGVPAYAHPLGEDVGSAVNKLISYSGSDTLIFDYIPEGALSIYSGIIGYSADFQYFDKYSDFFSEKDDFVDISRTGHPRKYTDLRSFTTHYSFDIKLITPNRLADCRSLLESWCLGRDCEKCVYGCEKKLEQMIFDNWESLPVRGVIVYIAGEPQGYLLGEQNGDTALILYGKPVGRENGLNVYMHIALIERCFPDVKYVNYSPDSGMDGLRLFKSKFTPYIKLKKYYCTLSKT